MNVQMYKCIYVKMYMTVHLGYLEQSILTRTLCYSDLSPIYMSESYKQEEPNGQQR